MNQERTRTDISPARAALKALFVLAVTLCLAVILAHFIKGQDVDALKHDMSLSASVVAIVIINLMSFACFIAMFAAWQWVRYDLEFSKHDELEDSQVRQIPRLSRQREICSYFVRKVLPECGYRKSLRFFLMAQLNEKTFSRWLKFLDRALPGDTPDNIQLRLAQRTFRPYMRSWLRVADRTDLLIWHYSALKKYFSASTLSSIMQGAEITIATVTGKSGRTYSITMGMETTKEGEICFSFIDTEVSARLAQIRGALGIGADQLPVFWIGGLQGAKPPLGRQEIVSATRDLNGLRPKHAVLQGACAFALSLQVERIIAPGRYNHISQRGWRKWSKKRHIYADYNEFWEEFSTVRTAEDDFCLSLPLPRRKPSEILAKRRKEWLRRYERIDAIADSTASALIAMAENKVPSRVLLK